MHDDTDPDDGGELLTPGEVRRLLHVSPRHLQNLRNAGVLRGFKLVDRGHWRYPSNQPLLAEARAALRARS